MLGPGAIGISVAARSAGSMNCEGSCWGVVFGLPDLADLKESAVSERDEMIDLRETNDLADFVDPEVSVRVNAGLVGAPL